MINEDKIKQGVELILEGIGEDLQREGLKDTPDRIARMYKEIMAGYDDSAKTHLSKRLQIQERMTSQIADALMDELKCKGVMVMLEAEHLCVSMRGIKKPGSQTVSFVCRGVFEENTKMQEKFLQIVKR